MRKIESYEYYQIYIQDQLIVLLHKTLLLIKY